MRLSMDYRRYDVIFGLPFIRDNFLLYMFHHIGVLFMAGTA